MKVDDDQIYRDMCGPLSNEDMKKVTALLTAWADVTDNMKEANDVRTVFLACVNTIGTMGPAYCKIAAVNLMAKSSLDGWDIGAEVVSGDHQSKRRNEKC
jgi:hypothetical protein